MYINLQFHPEVYEDIKESYDWYENQILGLGDKFIEDLENGYVSIENFPNTWANFQYGFKRYILNKFPYSILYKQNNNIIYIIAIMHNSRKPNFWMNRLIKK